MPLSLRHEPEAGARLEPGDFANVIRLTLLVAIDMIVRSTEGRMLVGRRTYEPARGWFFVPGGHFTKTCFGRPSSRPDH